MQYSQGNQTLKHISPNSAKIYLKIKATRIADITVAILKNCLLNTCSKVTVLIIKYRKSPVTANYYHINIEIFFNYFRKRHKPFVESLKLTTFN